MILDARRYRRAVLCCILLAALLRLAGLGWDHGQGLHPDEGNLVRAALGLSLPDALLPEFHAYNDLSLWLPRLLALPLCGPPETACLTLAARLVSALFSLATVALAARLGRLLGGRIAGAAAAAVFAVSAPLVQWAHFGTTESALVFLVLALWLCAALRLRGRIGDRAFALASGALLGLGFGLKTTALALAIIPLSAVLLSGWHRARLRPLMQGAALAVALALLVTPSLWLAWADWIAVMRFEGGVVRGTVPVFWTVQFHAARDGLFEIRQLWGALSGAGLLLAVPGLLLLARRSRPAALPGLGFALVYAAIVMGWDAKFFRYLAPLVAVLLVLAALGVAALLRSRSRSAGALALAGLGIMALAGVDQAALYLRDDPRQQAADWLVAQSGPGARVGVEPHDLALTGGLSRVPLPLTDGRTSPEPLAQALAESDWLLIASRRNWAVLPHGAASAPLACAYYARLASAELGFAVARSFRRDGPFGRLFAPGLAAEETRAVFDRPVVIVLRNEARLTGSEIAARLAQGAAAADCAPARIAAGWGQLR